ncbi:Regulatory protein RecX [uncultured bacterium]|nr:Regulatory protein RecX [uncultured bacterium]
MKKSGPDNKDALGAALRLLGVRQRSVFELKAKLRDKGFEGVDIDTTAEKLLKAGYLNDEEFARSLARSRARNKAWGPAKIAHDLITRGIAKETVKEAVTLACPAEEELASIALEKWRRSHKGLSGREEKEKAFRHLSSRGFSPSAIWKAFGRPDGTED